MMENINRTPEEINKQINDPVIQKFKDMSSNISTSNDQNKYQDKFQIFVSEICIIPYNIQNFIHNRIEIEMKQGYIESKERTSFDMNDEDFVINRIPLDKIHKVTYIYNPKISENYIYRMHQTIEDYNKSKEPIKSFELPFEVSTSMEVIGDCPSQVIPNYKYYNMTEI